MPRRSIANENTRARWPIVGAVIASALVTPNADAHMMPPQAITPPALTAASSGRESRLSFVGGCFTISTGPQCIEGGVLPAPEVRVAGAEELTIHSEQPLRSLSVTSGTRDARAFSVEATSTQLSDRAWRVRFRTAVPDGAEIGVDVEFSGPAVTGRATYAMTVDAAVEASLLTAAVRGRHVVVAIRTNAAGAIVARVAARRSTVSTRRRVSRPGRYELRLPLRGFDRRSASRSRVSFTFTAGDQVVRESRMLRLPRSVER